MMPRASIAPPESDVVRVEATARAVRLRARIALYAAAGALLFVLERLLPNPVPWARLGLANVVTLVVLLEHGTAAAAAVLALRLVLGGLFSGALFGPAFVLSVCGGTASFAAMALAAALGRRVLSPLGMSLAGAAAHAAAQLGGVAVLFAGPAVFGLLPLFGALALATGAATGFLADVVLARLARARTP